MPTRCRSVSRAACIRSRGPPVPIPARSKLVRPGASAAAPAAAGLLGYRKRGAGPGRRRRTQHIRGPGDKPVNHRAQALQLALAIRARGDMGFGRGNLACGQDLQSVGKRQLGDFAAVVEGTRGLHASETSTVSFWIGVKWPRGERSLSRACACRRLAPRAVALWFPGLSGARPPQSWKHGRRDLVPEHLPNGFPGPFSG